MADTTFLDLIPGWSKHEHAGWHEIGGFDLGHPALNETGHITLTHAAFGTLVVLFILVLAFIARGKYSNRETALIPEGKFSIRNFFEVIFDGIFGMMSGMMSEKQAKRHFPIVATLAVFIFVSNIIGLIPGLSPPTSSLNTNIGPAIIVFIVYNLSGLLENRWDYVKHFFGPVIFIAPLMFVIEIIGHLARPLSLGLRLTGNMAGDHMVLSVFSGLANDILGAPILFPIPFYFLGLLVCIVQTAVFCILTSVYISLAVAHEEH